MGDARRVFDLLTRKAEAFDGAALQVDREEPVFAGPVEPVAVEGEVERAAAGLEFANEVARGIVLKHSIGRALRRVEHPIGGSHQPCGITEPRGRPGSQPLAPLQTVLPDSSAHHVRNVDPVFSDGQPGCDLGCALERQPANHLPVGTHHIESPRSHSVVENVKQSARAGLHIARANEIERRLLEMRLEARPLPRLHVQGPHSSAPGVRDVDRVLEERHPLRLLWRRN